MYTLTLEDIQNSPTLQSYGAIPGDQINDENGLVRVFSQEEDFVGDTGEVLTQQTITSSPTLQKLGAQVGDRVIDNKLVKTKNSSAFRQFMYGFDESGNIVSNLATILEAAAPLGELTIDFNSFDYKSPSELYGPEFKDASFQERRELILRKKERDLLEEYSPYFTPEDGGARTAGSVAKAIADPTTLIPMGKALPVIAATGGALGVTYSVTEDMVEDGKVDPSKAFKTGVFSALLPPALVGAGRAVVNKATQRSANVTIDKAQAVINDQVALGKNIDEPSKILLAEGVNPAKVEQAIKITGRKLRIPANSTSAEKAVQEAMTTDNAVSRLYSPALDRITGAISTRLGNIAPELKARLRRYEFNTHKLTHEALEKATPFLKELARVSPNVKSKLALHLFNGEAKAAEGLMRTQAPQLLNTYTKDIRKLLDDTKISLKEAGHKIEDVDNYFPRLVKDYDGLVDSFGREQKGTLRKSLDDYAKSKNKTISDLTKSERSNVLDMAIRGYRMTTDGGKPRFVKGRKIDKIKPNQLQFYASPEESLSMYIRGSVNDIERRAFFGRSTTADKTGNVDIDASVGSLVDDIVAKGNITSKQEGEIRDILQARFIGGEKTTGPAQSFIRNTGYMGTIANPISALTQLGDAATSAALYGFRNTISAMFGAKQSKLVDIGLENVITKELGGDPSVSAEVLSNMMKASGFATIDRLGKETILNASLKQARQAVKLNNNGTLKSTKNFNKFKEKNKAYFGDEFDSLVDDLRNGTMSDNVKLLLFNNLADIQPIALSEMPEHYLKSPGSRIFYMLKSFTLKQYDVVRNNIVRQYKAGNKQEAIRNAVFLAGYLTAANTGTQIVKDMLLGREVRPEDLPERAAFALVGVYGLNKYLTDRYLSVADVPGALVASFVPAMPIVEGGFDAIGETIKDDSDFLDEKDYSTSVKAIPIVGPMLYNLFYGGAEKFNERLDDDD